VAVVAGPGQPPAADDRPATTAEHNPLPPMDAFGDPLPPGALARVGSTRLRHGNVVWALAFAPDGASVASAGNDGFVHIWDVKTGKERLGIEEVGFPLPGLGAVRGLAWAPGGKILAGARLNRPPCLWDAGTGTEVRTFGGNFRAAWVVFAPDGKTLAWGGDQDGMGNEDPFVHLADAASGDQVLALAGHKGRVAHAAFAPDGKLLASAGGDGTLRLWDVAAGGEVGRLETRDGPAVRVAFSPDGKTLAACGQAQRWLRLWEVGSRKEQLSVRLAGKQEGFSAVLFSPDGKALITGHDDGTVRTWDARTGAPLRRFRAHPGAVSALALSPDGKVLASSANVHTTGEFAVRLWDAATGRPLLDAPGPQQGIAGVTFSPDGRLLAAASWEGAIHLADATSGKVRCRVDAFGPLAFSGDGKTLVTGGWGDGVVRVWDAEGREVRRFPGQRGGIARLALAGDGKALVTAGGDHLRLWDLAAGREVHDFGGKTSPVLRLALSPDGKVLASAHLDNTVRLWDAAAGRPLRQVAALGTQSGALVFSPDGQVLAWSDGHEAIHLTDPATGRELNVLQTPEARPDPLDTLAFSPDGKTLAWGGQHQNGVYLWEVATGQLRRSLRGHTGHVTAVAFAPDNTRLASGSADATVLVWDAAGRSAAAGPLTEDRLGQLWFDLGGERAAVAGRALAALADSPRQARALLRKHLRPVAAADPRLVADLLGDLDNDDFRVRQKASEGLARLGEAAEPALRKLLEGNPSPEVRRTAEGLLGRLGGPESLRRSRALEVLEWIGDEESLKTLAGGAPGARLTREAAAALERLRRRAAP
jgi:WD40 repeat protein